jgi:NitT/TauT family transport system substrate-binding protein
VDSVGSQAVSRAALFTLVWTAAAGLAGCQTKPSSAEIRTIRIAIHRDPVAFLPVRVARVLGYDREEGIAIEPAELAGGTKAIEAMLGGSADVAAGSMSDAVALAAQGRQIRGFLLMYARPSIALAVAPAASSSIRTIRDLKGRTVGVSAPGSASHQFLNFLLVTNGLAGDDVSTVSVGMSSTSISALEHGQVDAAVLLASAIPSFELRNPASPFLADTRTLEGAKSVFGSEIFPALSLLAEDGWLEHNADSAQRLVRAMKKAMHWVREQPVERVREMIPEEARMTPSEADFRAIREVQAAMSSDGVVPVGSAAMIEKFVAVSDGRVRAAHVDPETIYTNRFAQQK